MTNLDQTPQPTPRNGQEEPVTPPLIFSYTRAQALADGALIDVTAVAKEAGFVLPVAVTAAVWAEYVAVPTGVAGQDETGRLWDVLNMLRFAVRGAAGDGPELLFHLHVRS